MGNYQKLLKKLLQKPIRTDITFGEVYNFLTSDEIGCTATDNGGSHCKFRKGERLITIPRKEIKAYTIKQIKELLDELGLVE